MVRCGGSHGRRAQERLRREREAATGEVLAQRVAWSAEEDAQLFAAGRDRGRTSWAEIASAFPGRSGESCRHRFVRVRCDEAGLSRDASAAATQAEAQGGGRRRRAGAEEAADVRRVGRARGMGVAVTLCENGPDGAEQPGDAAQADSRSAWSWSPRARPRTTNSLDVELDMLHTRRRRDRERVPLQSDTWDLNAHVVAQRIMQVGWDRGRRVRGNLIYITLQNGKVHIEYDGIEHGITDDLVNQGIPEQDIVLAFLSEPEITTAA